MKKKQWLVEYKYKESTGDNPNWKQLSKCKTRDEAKQLMKEKKRMFPFCEFRAIGPTNEDKNA